MKPSYRTAFSRFVVAACCAPAAALAAGPTLTVPVPDASSARVRIEVVGGSPGEAVTVAVSSDAPSPLCRLQSCPEWDLENPALLGSGYLDGFGVAQLWVDLPTGHGGGAAVWVQAAVGDRVSDPQPVAVPFGGADADGDGWTLAQGDCDDAEPATHPGAFEWCGDGIDNDCDLLWEPLGGPVARCCDQAAGPWSLHDIRVSDPAANISDAEYDEVGLRYAWQPRDGFEVFAGSIDPFDGTFSDPSGREELVASDVVPRGLMRNGPEWLYTDRGSEVLFAKRIPGSDIPWAHRAWRDGVLGWQSEPVTQGAAPIGSKLRGDPDPVFTVARVRPWELWWSDLEGERGVLFADNRPFAPRIGAGTHQIVWSQYDPIGTGSQVHGRDLHTGASGQLTFDQPHKGDAGTFLSPERGQLLLFAALEGGDGRPRALGVYAPGEGSGTLELIHIVFPPTDFPYLLSPEALVFDGVSYLVFVAADDVSDQDPGIANGRGQVWLVGAEPDNPVFRPLTDADLVVRKDPEVFDAGHTAWVYYTEITDAGRAVRRAATGL